MEHVPGTSPPAPPSADRNPSRTVAAWILLAIAVGAAIRLSLAWWTVGTNDTRTWAHFAALVREVGLLEAYRIAPTLNHPPLPVVWAWICGVVADVRIANVDSIDERFFGFLMKLPAIAADLVACLMLWRMDTGGGRRTAIPLATILALSPLHILVSGYHGNTDNVYAMLSLAAFCCMGRRRAFAAGLLLGAAMNIKLIPVLLVPALLACSQSRAEFKQAVAGLALPLLVFVIPAVGTSLVFVVRLVDYGSNPDDWGVLLLGKLVAGLTSSGDAHGIIAPARWYFLTGGRWIMIGAIVTAAACCRAKRVDPLTAAGVGAAVFLLLTPGFGVQYLVLPALLILAADRRFGGWMIWLGGAFVAAAYFVFLNHTERHLSEFYGPLPSPVNYVGLVVWLVLLGFIVTVLLGGSHRRAPQTP